jgi:Na+/proline symporter
LYRAYAGDNVSERQYVNIGRVITVGLLILAGLFALKLENALDAFEIILQIGAGTGLIYILRWFWYRINAAGEITAMIVSFLVAMFFQFILPLISDVALASQWKYLIGMSITTIAWLLVTLVTKPTDKDVLVKFYQRIKPHAAGWQPIAKLAGNDGDSEQKGSLGLELVAMITACFGVYSLLFGIGSVLYKDWTQACIFGFICLVSAYLIRRWWPRFSFK